MRRALVVVHRWVGLAIAVFVIVAGLTGSVLAFHDELDALAAPALHAVADPGAPALDALVLRERIAAQLPGVRVDRIHLEPDPTTALVVSVEPAVEGGDDQVFVDPGTGAVLGSRRWGDVSQGLVNLVPFLYRLHYSLALDTVGSWLFGAAALLWTLDCFVALALTLPPATVRSTEAPWARRWARAWWLSGKQLLFTWHRASGLWIWGFCLVFAWSAVGMNLQPVYLPLMEGALGFEGHWSEVEERTPGEGPVLGWPEARERGRALVAEQAVARGFEVLSEWRLVHEPDLGLFQYRARSTLDVSARYPETTVWLDDRDGSLVQFKAPTGQAAGNTVEAWLFALHFAAWGGLPYRVFVAAFGLLVAALAGSGVWLWGRRAVLRARPARPSPAAATRRRPPGTRRSPR